VLRPFIGAAVSETLGTIHGEKMTISIHRTWAILLTAALAGSISQAATVEVISVPSQKMGKEVPVTMILPEGYKTSTQELPVVFLLHGAGDTHAKWNDSTDVAELSDEYGVIFVCPCGDRTSWYFDSPIDPGSQYETFVAKECVAHIDKHYRTKADRRYRAICGNSMGGHGAMFLSIRHQDVFSIAVPLSGGVDIRPYPDRWGIKDRIGPISKEWDKYAVMELAKGLKDGDLAISIDCGSGDFFLGVNRALHAQLLDDGITHQYVEKHGGHTWSYWNVAIKRQMPFIVQQFKGAKKKEPQE